MKLTFIHFNFINNTYYDEFNSQISLSKKLNSNEIYQKFS
jgi:hypothetical protein